jgi:hypothetical protein
MAPKQTLIWTALPNGVDNPAAPKLLKISVFLSPQLSSGNGNAPLGTFADFHNWPAWIAGPPGGTVSFFVVFKNGTKVHASLDPSMPRLDGAAWQLVFNSGVGTNVKDYVYTDLSQESTATYSSVAAQKYLSGLYGTVGYNSQASPPVFGFNSDGPPAISPASVAPQVKQMVGIDYVSSLPVTEAAAYYASRTLPKNTPIYVPSPLALDFHQTVAGFGSYPIIMRMFGLVFDLTIPIPAGVPAGTTTVQVQPKWTPHPGTNVTTTNVSLWTACTIGAGVFKAAVMPGGSGDYANGMLKLNDASRFSVTSLDVDGGSMRTASVTQSMNSLLNWEGNIGILQDGETISVPLPTLRSTGAALVHNNHASVLTTQLARQTAIANAVQSFVATNNSSYLTSAPFPLYAGDIMRGHRFDVYTSSDSKPAWLSLHQRYGSYSFGPGAGPNAPATALPFSKQDEGFTSFGASGPPPNLPNPSAQLYIHEEICRWRGWSLNASRYGSSLSAADANGQANDTSVPNGGNPADKRPDAAGHVSPQFSASFTVPTTASDATYQPAVETVKNGTLPKLRYGNQYQMRARGVDLAGNGLPVSTTDPSTATSPFTHYRYSPVAPPVLAPTAVYPPGQAVLQLAILNNMDGNTPTANARWFFPPKVNQLLAEEHGMFDVAAVGGAPSNAAPVSGSAATYSTIVSLDQGSIQSLGESTAGAAVDPNWAGGDGAWYFPPSILQLATPWIPDPLALGVAFWSMPGLPGNPPGLGVPWLEAAGESWPGYLPFQLQLVAASGSSPATTLTNATATASAVVTTALPVGSVYDVRVASMLVPPKATNPAAPNYTNLGVYQWILSTLEAQVPASGQAAAIAALNIDAELGGLWTLSPYVTLRLIHATRTPTVQPLFEQLTMVSRPYGSTSVDLYDPSFNFDPQSTVMVHAEASWTDHVDDPTDILNQPGVSTTTTLATAFEVQVPDPKEPDATANPGFVTHAPQVNALLSNPGVRHEIGDTRHHHVSYVPVGTSRFAELFRPARPIPFTQFTDTAPVQLPTAFHGINPGSVVMTDQSGNVLDPGEYVVNPNAGTIALVNAPPSPVEYAVDYEPIVTSIPPPPSGEPWEQAFGTKIDILSSARPATPKIDRVVPAWQTATHGTVSSGKAYIYAREGGWLRVWLDRPWYSSGDGEMLGIVALPSSLQSTQPPADPGYHLTTILGLDPISVADPSLVVPTTPAFGGVATLPTPIPGRPAYTNPPLVQLLEDQTPGRYYDVYPFEANYDSSSGQWYADVQIAWNIGSEPPPGYFVRLACVRFQPYSCLDAEVSPVALATFTQPVSSRGVSVVNVPELQAVKVFIGGPSYQGFRPAAAQGDNGFAAEDTFNDDWLHPYSDNLGAPAPSTMVVEVEIQDTTVFTGDLAWRVAAGISPAALVLEPEIQGPLTGWSGLVQLPYPIGQGPFAQRLRISEIDYYTGSGAPTAAVDTSYRRPFVCHIPIQ